MAMYGGEDDPRPDGGGGDSGKSGRSGLKAMGQSLRDSGARMMEGGRAEAASHVGPVAYKRGGKVRKTGPAIVHKGERVIPKSKVRKVERMMKRSKMKMRASGRG